MGRGCSKPCGGWCVYLGLGTDRAGGDEVPDVLPHPRPPELALYKGGGPISPWMAIESGGVTPLDDLGSNFIWDVKLALQAVTGCGPGT